jgi:protein-tyrosine phosphatase
MSIITDHIFIGSIGDASSSEFINKNNIKGVLNVASELDRDDATTQCLYKHIKTADSVNQNIRKYFDEAFDFIDSVDGPVLVHCAAGISRSATIVIAYLMKKYKIPMMAAFDYVKAHRSIINPNFHFIGQLMSYESEIL